jgi:hydroxyacylglutathione hydrolase
MMEFITIPVFRSSFVIALLAARLVAAAGSPPAVKASPPAEKASPPATKAAARDRSRLLEGVGAPLQVFQVPEAAGRDFSDANAYVVCDRQSGEAMIIDAGSRSAPLALGRARGAGLRVSLLVSTHFHPDHTAGNSLVLSRTSARMVAPLREVALLTGEGSAPAAEKEKKQAPGAATPRVDLKVKQGDELKLGEHAVKVIEIAGHSPGGICLYFPAEKLLFTGDSLLKGSIGRLGIPSAARTAEGMTAMIRSRLLTLPDDTAVLPGHGPLTTIGGERAANPWLKAKVLEEKASPKVDETKKR